MLEMLVAFMSKQSEVADALISVSRLQHKTKLESIDGLQDGPKCHKIKMTSSHASQPSTSKVSLSLVAQCIHLMSANGFIACGGESANDGNGAIV